MSGALSAGGQATEGRLCAGSWRQRLRVFANSAVGVPLGLGGQAVLWKNIGDWGHLKESLQDLEPVVEVVHWFFFLAVIATLIGFLVIYTLKALVCWDVVQAEFNNPVRSNFISGPCIALCMIGLAKPLAEREDQENHEAVLRTIWFICLLYQTYVGLLLYHRWLRTISTLDWAAPPYLLSIVSWFFLAALGTPADIDTFAELPLRAMCFGIGTLFSFFVYPFIFIGIIQDRAPSQSLFLMVAPPSVAAIAMTGMAGEANAVAVDSLFGAVVFLLALLIRGQPLILARPVTMGVYWAYVFPTCAVAVLSMREDSMHATVATEVLAFILIFVALVAFLMVLTRFVTMVWAVSTGRDYWTDPLVHAIEQKLEHTDETSAPGAPTASQRNLVDSAVRD